MRTPGPRQALRTAHRTAHRTARRATAAVAALALAGMVLGAALASASSLSVQATNPAWVDQAVCTAGAVVKETQRSSNLTTEVSVAGVDGVAYPSTCLGLPIRVVFLTWDGTVVGEAAEQGTDGTLVVAPGVLAWDVSSAAVVLGGFVVPTSWRPLSAPADTCVIKDATSQAVVGTCTFVPSSTGLEWNSGWPSVGITYVPHIGGSPGTVPTGSYLEFRVTLPALNPPSWFTWTGAGIINVQPGSDRAITSRCSELPTVRGWLGAGSTYLYLQIRSGPSQPPGYCAAP